MGDRLLLAIMLMYLVDWLLLMGISAMNGDPLQPAVTAFSVLPGAAVAILYVCTSCVVFKNVLIRIAMLVLSGVCSFGFCLKKNIEFLLADLGLSAIAMGIGLEDGQSLGFGLLLLFVLSLLLFWNNDRSQQVSVCVQGVKEPVSFRALYDTGNFLRDPVTGSPVMIASRTLCKKLLGIDPEALADPANCVISSVGLRLVPFQTVGSSGLLVAKRFENVLLNGRKRSVVVAFSPNEIGSGKSFCALMGGI